MKQAPSTSNRDTASMLTQMVQRLPLSDVHFRRISQLIYQRAGIVLAEHKREMVYNRLVRRLRLLGLHDFGDYLALLESDPNSAEWQAFINALTTNLTAFFREAHHFPILAEHARSRPNGYSVWSTAASTGEEPYSIAITLSDAWGSGPAVARSGPATSIRRCWKSGGGRLPPGRSAHPDADPNAALFSARHRSASGAGARAAGVGGASELSAAESAGAGVGAAGAIRRHFFAATS